MTCLEEQQPPGPIGSLDGEGAGDHDRPYRFGWRPRTSQPFPFSTRQYARLLVVRGRFQDHLVANGEAEGKSLPPASA